MQAAAPAGPDGEPASQQPPPLIQPVLRFTHVCRFTACANPACELCANNPRKACGSHDYLRPAYADHQALVARCGASLWLGLVDGLTGNRLVGHPPLDIQLSLVDGQAANPPTEVGGQPAGIEPLLMELLQTDEGLPLLSCGEGGALQQDGRIHFLMRDGVAPLPTFSVTEKNETLRLGGAKHTSFSLLAAACTPLPLHGGAGGQPMLLLISPAVSLRFAVKTQRALKDWSKPEWPHVRERATMLPHVGDKTVCRLQALLNSGALGGGGGGPPVARLESVGDVKALLEWAAGRPEAEERVRAEIGRKSDSKRGSLYDELLQLLRSRVICDDHLPRAWLPHGSSRGLLYPATQAQVDLEAPPCGWLLVGEEGAVAGGEAGEAVWGVASEEQPLQWAPIVTGGGGMMPPQVAQQVQALAVAAVQSWQQPGHPGWRVVRQPLVLQASAALTPQGALQQLYTPAAAAGFDQPLVGLETFQAPVRRKPTHGCVTTEQPVEPLPGGAAAASTAAAPAAAAAAGQAAAWPPALAWLRPELSSSPPRKRRTSNGGSAAAAALAAAAIASATAAAGAPAGPDAAAGQQHVAGGSSAADALLAAQPGSTPLGPGGSSLLMAGLPSTSLLDLFAGWSGGPTGAAAHAGQPTPAAAAAASGAGAHASSWPAPAAAPPAIMDIMPIAAGAHAIEQPVGVGAGCLEEESPFRSAAAAAAHEGLGAQGWVQPGSGSGGECSLEDSPFFSAAATALEEGAEAVAGEPAAVAGGGLGSWDLSGVSAELRQVMAELHQQGQQQLGSTPPAASGAHKPPAPGAFAAMAAPRQQPAGGSSGSSGPALLPLLGQVPSALMSWDVGSLPWLLSQPQQAGGGG